MLVITGVSSRLVEHSLQRVVVLFGESFTLGESVLQLGVGAGFRLQLVRAARRARRDAVALLSRQAPPPAAMFGPHVLGSGLHRVLAQVVVRFARRQIAHHNKDVVT